VLGCAVREGLAQAGEELCDAGELFRGQRDREALRFPLGGIVRFDERVTVP
jgi:hypothetical protein